MFIQYAYAIGTMIPCPLWFWYRWFSAGFLLVVFVWSVYNGATFYIDVFGKRFQNELEQLKREVTKVQMSSEVADGNPVTTPKAEEPAAKTEEMKNDGSLVTEATDRPENDGQEQNFKEWKIE